MTRLTRADIKALLEGDPRFTHTAPSGAGGRGDLFRGVSLSQQTRQAGEAQAKKEAGQPKKGKFSFTRIDASGGREVSSIGTTDDLTTAFKGAHSGYATDSSGKKVYVHRKHESVKSYYHQLKESWWCATKPMTELMVQPSDDKDETYARYAAIMKGIDAARSTGAKSIRTAGRIGGKAVEVINPTLGKAINAGGQFQADIIQPKRAKLRDWVGEDTMTGDIGSVAVPFVAPGETEEERQKKRKKRRKLGVVLAAATGSVQGTGN